MRHAITLLAALGLSAFIPGCFVIADLDRFETDTGCDLDQGFSDFGAHAGRHMGTFSLVVDPEDSDGAPRIRANIILDPVPSVDFNFTVPNGVQPGGLELDFYADLEGNGFTENDHQWRIEDVCRGLEQPFVHSFEFDVVQEPIGIEKDFAITVDGLPATGDGEVVEVQVFATDESGDIFVGGYRLAGETGGTVDMVVPGILDSGIDYVAHVWVDRNNSCTYEPFNGADPDNTDRAYRIPFRGADVDGDDPLLFDLADPSAETFEENIQTVLVSVDACANVDRETNNLP